MTQEQKAKAYDEALKVLHKYDGENIMFSQSLKEEMFPELAESEDEKIRKWIVTQLELKSDVNNPHDLELMILKSIAWLERQGEQNDSDVKDYNSIDPYFGKSINKVEPKFEIEEGKWYVCTQTYTLRGKIIAIKGKTYQAEKDNVIKGEDGCRFINRHDGKASDYFRYWAIEDAKDGDVLFYKDEISLYKHDIKNCTKQEPTFGGFVYHCCYDGKRFIMDSLYSLTEQDKMDIHPATKEQRELLFQRMKEAGYEWDSEKKELKKIVVPIFHIGNTIIKKHNSDINDFGSFIITNITGGKYWYKDRIICDITKQDEWELYEPVRKKPAEWSEEDERTLQGIRDEILANKHDAKEYEWKTYDKFLDWLKSLKDRV